jgi:hemerythrin superfamily protein
MDAITMLKDDHRTVEKLFKEFEKLHKNDGTPRQKADVVKQITQELGRHTYIEEQLFYPDARKEVESTEETVLEAIEEHHLVKFTLTELEQMSPDDERFDAKVTVMIESVRHHVEEEENEFFPEVRKTLGRKRLQELGEELAELKAKAPTFIDLTRSDEPKPAIK